MKTKLLVDQTLQFSCFVSLSIHHFGAILGVIPPLILVGLILLSEVSLGETADMAIANSVVDPQNLLQSEVCLSLPLVSGSIGIYPLVICQIAIENGH